MMTHLNENVQEDSLRLFDVLIQSIPGLLATRCDKIIQNFVLLISKIKINANDKSMLQTTIKNKRTSVEWRLMVLTRFNEFLGVILTRKKQENVIDIVPINIIKVERQRISAPIYYKKEEIDIYRDDINVDVWLDDCVKDVLVLLKGIWLEVQPSNKHSIQSAQLFCTVINNEVLNILHCILSIISSFYELMVIKTQENQEIKIQNEIFLKTSKEIVNLIFESFPFSKQNNRSMIDSKCFDENLTLCYLFFAFSGNDYNKKLVEQALTYLNVCLVNRNYVPHEKSQFLLKALKQFYENNLKAWKKHNQQDLNGFVNNTAKYYINNNLQENGVEIFKFLCENIDSIEGIFFEVVRKACKSLIGPKIGMEMFKSIRILLLRRINEVEIVLSLLLPEILNNLSRIEFEGIEHASLKEARILSLFKSVPLNVKNHRVLEEFSKLSENNKKLVNNFFENELKC
nr:testis-expressed protein 10-like [Onthophagus taurus]